MPLYDLRCDQCNTETEVFTQTIPDRFVHMDCGSEMNHVWRPSAKTPRVHLDDQAAIVVFKDREGKIRYPGRNDAKTPPDCERVVMRSIREVDKFCAANHVRNEAFDRPTGGMSTWTDDYGRTHREGE